MALKKNTGKTDRIMRMVMLGSFILFILTGIAHYPQVYFLEILIVLLSFTAAFGFCPIYAAFGINTCECEHQDKDKVIE